jgi:antitoxin (DNA-binding transcriptional repressor) of toxin-antitoxin stability system
MPVTVPIETAERNLKNLLGRLRPGEAITLTSSEGSPLALLVSLRSEPRVRLLPDWDARWDALARRVSQAWKSEKSAVEILSEMRR